MAGQVVARLAAAGHTLPAAASPAGNYRPWQRVGALVFISAQGPVRDGVFVHTGAVGGALGVAEGQAAAELTALNVLAQLEAACAGDLDRVRRVVKLVGFINAAPGFTDLAPVLDAASDLMVTAFGDAGRHARAAVAAGAMPGGLSVALDAVAEVA